MTDISAPEPTRKADGFDRTRVRGWLVAMTRQGEDQIWRGAVNALAAYDALERESSGLRIGLWNMLTKIGVHQDLAIQIIREAAQGIETRSAMTEGHGPKDESAVRQDAP